ncbi:MAG: hypothetical protein KJ856_03385 [Gammaproteobacteria bacterium]|nr:hypothetical protein [Gammaproteobacteria bacterium]MBU1475872.1 hypothetical protein [Gammaproteobacteria bacterium]MBU2000564.1 hypothetical protein [Gammaproteobacteria bacterium]MBU2132869.1 hypothetical protein [Gammaproteobacteria bacterium]MBU2186066.1 hypothetical protein [Gammaproteobacteria bacterium]
MIKSKHWSPEINMDMLLAENSPIRQQLLEQKLAQFKDPLLAHTLSAFIVIPKPPPLAVVIVP